MSLQICQNLLRMKYQIVVSYIYIYICIQNECQILSIKYKWP